MLLSTFYGTHPGDLQLDGAVTRVAVVTDSGYRVEITDDVIRVWDGDGIQVGSFKPNSLLDMNSF